MKTSAAQAAALIRKEIKAAFPSVKARVVSENYSMGSSVRVYIEDQPKEIYAAIERIADKYEYGTFDGMTDSYNYDKVNKDLPQAKYVFVKNEMSDAKRQEVYAAIRSGYHGGDALPESYEAARDINFQGHYISQFVWQQFCAQ